MRRWFLPAAAALLAACGASEVRVERGVEFAPGLRADLYLPSDAREVPAVVLLHGGGFREGRRDDLEGYARALASRGVATATIDYRLGEDTLFPLEDLDDERLLEAAARARDDALAAVEWLAETGRTRGIDPRRIVVAGYSAGGIAALEAASHGTAAAGGFAIAGGAIDLEAIDAGGPPLFLLHGEDDRVVPAPLARATCERAAEVGARCDLHLLPGVGHGLLGTERERILRTLAEFAKTVPPRGPAPTSTPR